jgi:hypothetical protein
MTDQRLVANLQHIIDNYDCLEAMRIIIGELRTVFNKHDGIHPSPYTNHVTALALALEEVHPA